MQYYGYWPYDFQRAYVVFSSACALHKITRHLPFKGHYTNLNYNNLIPPLLRSHVTSGLSRQHTPLSELKTDMSFEIHTYQTSWNQVVG